MKHFAVLICLALAGVLTFAGCDKKEEAAEDPAAEGTEEPTPAANPPAEEAAPEGEAAEPAAAGDTAAAGTCGQARKCCEAYVSTMGGTISAEQACSGIDAAAKAGAAGEQSCKTMIGSWRQALTNAQKDVPADCKE